MDSFKTWFIKHFKDPKEIDKLGKKWNSLASRVVGLFTQPNQLREWQATRTTLEMLKLKPCVLERKLAGQDMDIDT